MGKILGIILLVCGLVMIGASFYIKNQVATGKLQIAEGQSKVDQTNSLFSITPQTKVLGNQLTQSGQNRINAGQQQVQKYEAMANQLQTGGIVVAIVGLGLILFSQYKKKRRNH